MLGDEVGIGLWSISRDQEQAVKLQPVIGGLGVHTKHGIDPGRLLRHRIGAVGVGHVVLQGRPQRQSAARLPDEEHIGGIDVQGFCVGTDVLQGARDVQVRHHPIVAARLRFIDHRMAKLQRRKREACRQGWWHQGFVHGPRRWQGLAHPVGMGPDDQGCGLAGRCGVEVKTLRQLLVAERGLQPGCGAIAKIFARGGGGQDDGRAAVARPRLCRARPQRQTGPQCKRTKLDR